LDCGGLGTVTREKIWIVALPLLIMALTAPAIALEIDLVAQDSVLGMIEPRLKGYHLSIPTPTGYALETGMPTHPIEYVAKGPMVKQSTYKNGELITTTFLSHTFSLGISGGGLAGDPSEAMRVYMGAGAVRTEIDGREAYYTDGASTGKFRLVIALTESSHEHSYGVETPYLEIWFQADDYGPDWMEGDLMIKWRINDETCSQHNAGIIALILQGIDIVEPSTAQTTATAQAPTGWLSRYDEYYSCQEHVTMTVIGYNGEVHFQFETDPSFGEYNEIIEGFGLSLDGSHVAVSGQATVDVAVSIEDWLKRGPSEYNRILPLDVVLKPVVVLEREGHPDEYVRANPVHITLLPKLGFTPKWTNPPEGDRVAAVSGSGYCVRKAGSEDWIEVGGASEETYLGAGDGIRGGDTPVTITWLESSTFGEGNRLHICGGATLVLPRAEEPTILDLVVGRIRSVIKALKAKTKFEVRTPVCVTSPRGTDYLVDVEEGGTTVLVLEGSVEVRDLQESKTVLLGAGEVSVATATVLPSDPERFDPGLLAERYGGLFESQQEVDTIVKAIAEVLALPVGVLAMLVLGGKMGRCL